MNKVQLLNEMDKLKHEYWNEIEKAENQYRKKKKEHDLYVGMTAKISRIRNKILDLRKEYQN